MSSTVSATLRLELHQLRWQFALAMVAMGICAIVPWLLPIESIGAQVSGSLVGGAVSLFGTRRAGWLSRDVARIVVLDSTGWSLRDGAGRILSDALHADARCFRHFVWLRFAAREVALIGPGDLAPEAYRRVQICLRRPLNGDQRESHELRLLSHCVCARSRFALDAIGGSELSPCRSVYGCNASRLPQIDLVCELSGRVMSQDESDQELVKRVQRGDQNAFNVLVLRYQHRVLKLVGRFARDSAEAEDIAQEAFIKAYRALASFRGDSAFYTWLYRIAINTAKNAVVSNRRRPVDFDLDLQDPEQFERQARMKEIDTPEGMLLSEEIRGTVAEAIAQLPEDLRTAIMLRELEGLSYEEIAEVMECPVGTVRSRIFRAREAIDRKLGPLLD
jgi:RNA polymerase sigma-70 factor (ECF subfamily)